MTTDNDAWLRFKTILGASSGANVNIKAITPENPPQDHMEMAIEAKKDALLREVNKTNLFYATLRSIVREPFAIETAYDNIGPNAHSDITQRKNKDTDDVIEFRPEQTAIRLLAANHARAELFAASMVVSPSDIQLQRMALNVLDEEVERLTVDDRTLYERVLYHIKNEFYSEVNAAADPKHFEEFKIAVRNVMTKTLNGEKRGKTFGFALGYVSSGKGTALNTNHISAVETGTEGILGHAAKFGYEHWTTTMAPFDLLRGYGVFYPDVLMTVSTGLEMLERRGELDADGKVHEAVFLSGFPRTAGHANSFFAGVDPETISGAVFLTIDRETAFERTIFRLFEDAMSPEGMRKDDVESLATSDTETYSISRLIKTIKGLASDFMEKALADVAADDTEARKNRIMHAKINVIRNYVRTIRSFGYDLNMTTARWFADEEKKTAMKEVLENLGITLKEIDVSNMSFEQEADVVGKELLK